MYTVDYFIKKFEAIPESKWGTKKYITGFKLLFIDLQKRCAQGLCILNKPKVVPLSALNTDPIYLEWKSLVLLFGGIVTGIEFSNKQVADINNGDDIRYQQPTPKQRILAALYDIKKMQEKENPVYENISSEIAILFPIIQDTPDKVIKPETVNQN